MLMHRSEGCRIVFVFVNAVFMESCNVLEDKLYEPHPHV